MLLRLCLLMTICLTGCHSCRARVSLKTWLYQIETEVVLEREHEVVSTGTRPEDAEAQ